MYVDMYVDIYNICVYIMYVCVYVYICIQRYMYMCVYIHMYMCVCEYICVCFCTIIGQLLVCRIIRQLNEKGKVSHLTCLFSSGKVRIKHNSKFTGMHI